MAVVGKFLITIPAGSATGGPHTNFPILVDSRVSDIPAEFWAAVSDANGLDIKFWSGDELTEYDREIVSINTGANELEAWVRVPSLASATENTIMCRVEDTTRVNDTGTWTAFESVWHMQEEPNGQNGNPVILDSAATPYNLTPAGFDAAGSSLVAGEIGNAIDFNGTDEYVYGSTLTKYTDDTQGIISQWANIDTDDGAGNISFGIGRNADATQSEVTINFAMSNDRWLLTLKVDGTKQWQARTANDSIDAHVGSFVKMDLRHDGVEPRFYINGALIALTFDDQTDKSEWLKAVTADATSVADRITICDHFRNGAGTGPFDGKIDETRITATDHGANWIATDYDAQNDPDAFMSCGAWELASSSSTSISSSTSSESSESSDSSESSSSQTSSSSVSVASVSTSSTSSASVSSDSSSLCVIVDCIQARITADIKAKLRGITVANRYNYDVAAVEEARHTLEINDRYPFILLLENEPEKEVEDDFFIRKLEYMIWFFSEQNDRNENVDTEIAYYNRNAIADITKALSSIDTEFFRNANAESTYIVPGTHEHYIDQDSGMSLFGTWCMCVVPCDIDARNPVFNR